MNPFSGQVSQRHRAEAKQEQERIENEFQPKWVGGTINNGSKGVDWAISDLSTLGGVGRLPRGRPTDEPDLLGPLALNQQLVMKDSRVRLRELDVLRCVAIALVLFRHSEGLIQRVPGWPGEILQALARWGWVGVDLFFVLSGFLVSGILFKAWKDRSQMSLSRFWVRRAFKILPGFWVYLGFITAVVAWRESQFPWGRFLAEMFFVQNYLQGLAGQTWSLAVEEHFYWLLPLVIPFYRRPSVLTRGGAVLMTFTAIALLMLVLRMITHLRLPYSHSTHLYPSHLRLDALFAGVTLSHLYWFHRETLDRVVQRWGKGIGCGIVLCLLPALIVPIESSGWISTLGLTANAIGFVLLAAVLLVRGLPWYRPLQGVYHAAGLVGTWSYGIYLWHLEVIGRLEFYGRDRVGPVPLLILGFAGSIGLGWLVTRWLERPLLKLRDRYFPGGANEGQGSTSVRTR